MKRLRRAPLMHEQLLLQFTGESEDDPIVATNTAFCTVQGASSLRILRYCNNASQIPTWKSFFTSNMRIVLEHDMGCGVLRSE